MNIYKTSVGPLQTNCYIVGNNGEAIIIDPGDEAEKILSVIKKNNLKVKSIVLTHNHFDHVGALNEIIKLTTSPASPKLQRGEQVINLKEGLSSVALAKEGDEIKIGEEVLKVIETPGHTKDSICLINEKQGIIFSGDTLFQEGIGRTDLEGGDFNEIKKSLKRLMEYPDNFKVYPGHGEETTIGKERNFIDY